MKQYKKKTPLLGIPVPWYKDRIVPEQEMSRFIIIENLLIAGMQGVGCAVFDDGDFRLEAETDEMFQVVLVATGSSPSAEGIIGSAYFNAPPELRWARLRKGYMNYLYLRGGRNTFRDHAAVRTVSSEYPIEGKANLLMAAVDLREEVPKLDTYPDGKIYSTDLARHASDSENPHGRRMYQDELVVTKKLFLRSEDGESPEVEVDVDGEAVSFPASSFAGAVAELAGRKVVVRDFDSAGRDGMVISSNGGKVLYAMVQRRAANGSGSVGEIAVGYHGEDAKADSEDEFVVYNSGNEGLPMRAFVICG